MQERKIRLEYCIDISDEKVKILEEKQTSDIYGQRQAENQLSDLSTAFFFTEHNAAEAVVQNNGKHDNQQIPPVVVPVENQ